MQLGAEAGTERNPGPNAVHVEDAPRRPGCAKCRLMPHGCRACGGPDWKPLNQINKKPATRKRPAATQSSKASCKRLAADSDLHPDSDARMSTDAEVPTAPGDVQAGDVHVGDDAAAEGTPLTSVSGEEPATTGDNAAAGAWEVLATTEHAVSSCAGDDVN